MADPTNSEIALALDELGDLYELDGAIITQLDYPSCESLGLLKMDFLGLRNLDVIDKACALLGNLDISKIPMDDKQTYKMLARGEATGVFQFESTGMREALRSVKPTTSKWLPRNAESGPEVRLATSVRPMP